MNQEAKGTLGIEILLDLYTVGHISYFHHLFTLLCYFHAAYVHFILISGKKAYNLTWVLQYINLFMINTGYIILAGSALKVRDLGHQSIYFLSIQFILKLNLSISKVLLRFFFLTYFSFLFWIIDTDIQHFRVWDFSLIETNSAIRFPIIDN